MLSQIIFNHKKHQTAVVLPNDNKFSYGDIQTYSKKINQKINGRCLVFCLSKNHIGSLCGYLSFISNRVVPLLLDSSISWELLKQLIAIYKPRYLWLPTDQSSEIQGGVDMMSLLDYTLIKMPLNSKCLLHDNLALLLPTSGSTGSPKLVKLTNKNIYSNATSISEYLSIDKNERPITSLPMHYSFGLSIINSHLINGATILLTNNSLMEKEFWAFLKSYEATSLSGIPYSFEILKKLRFFKMDFPYLKTLTQAGGKLNDALNREFSEYCLKSNKRFFVMYGQTEATARMSYLPPEYSIKKLGSMGIAIPGGDFFLIDENGNTIEKPDREGELVYKGRNVSMGYAKCRNDLANGDENNGVLVTGDLAKRDKDGFYYIVGRKKRFIKLFGNRVNLDETERLIKNIITDCACAGTDDKMIIFITQKDLIQDVKRFISTKTGINPKAFKVTAIDKIPKNSSGKTVYSQLFD
jgi:acyl-coenzyme A synthetase/AMP-(fatty) acid ligase